MAAQPTVDPSAPVVFRPAQDDQVVVLYRIPWAQYDDLCIVRENTAGPRMAYLKGTLEIMSPSLRHEFQKKLIARLLEAYAEEMNLSLDGFGSTTYRRKVKEAGLEPDECYCLGGVKKVPDLALEVALRRAGVDKLEIYRRLGVAEVWFWADQRFSIHVLTGSRYEVQQQSRLLPGLDLAELSRLVEQSDDDLQTETVRAYRRKLRRRAAQKAAPPKAPPARSKQAAKRATRVKAP